MLQDARNLREGAVLQADVCIAGAGAAGITLARDLAGTGRRVVLLEGGGTEVASDQQDLYRGALVGLATWSLSETRFRVLGGTTVAWAGWLRPLDPEDFDERDWLPHSGWPIRYEDLVPYYQRAHATVEAGAFEYDASTIADRAKLPLLPVRPEWFRTVFYRYSPPTRFGQRYAPELDAAPNVAVYLHANLVDIRLDRLGGAVSRVVCRTLQPRTTFHVEARQFVLALGGIENARLLLACRSQAADGLGNSHGLVGRFFMEHPHYVRQGAVLLRSDQVSALYRSMDVDFGERDAGGKRPVKACLAPSREAKARERLLGFGVDLSPAASGRDGDPLPASDVRSLANADGSSSDLWNVTYRVEQSPSPDNRVMLIENSEDALGLPRVELRWTVTEADVDSWRRGFGLLGRELGRARLGRLLLPRDTVLRTEPQPGCHHMGTTRMSRRPQDGVVDAQLRVHDVENLYVAGSSVFPTAGFANPTLTLVALAHRLADRLKDLV